jgi:WD40 repeat protein
MSPFKHSVAVVIGIDDYGLGIPRLRTAVADAARLALVLGESHGYDVRLLTEEVTLGRLRALLTQALAKEIGPDDRLLFYFAGHGIALDGDDGPAGYLVPQDARRDDRGTLLPMTELHDALAALPCRHLLLILDCCFAGSFHWSSTRELRPVPQVLHRQRYDRYVRDCAWQVLTSAAHDQQALDVLAGAAIGARREDDAHSPFAAALFRALDGAADLVPPARDGRPAGDGVITATELYLYLREDVEVRAGSHGFRQTPGLWPLKKHDKGEYIVLVPGRDPDLPPAPELNAKNNPYRGLQPYEEEHSAVFFGRAHVAAKLCEQVSGRPLTVVLGASGTGKSSVVKAGLVPGLRRTGGWQVLAPLRPGKSPLAALAGVTLPGAGAAAGPRALADSVGAWLGANPGSRLLLVVDQFEELITLCQDAGERARFLEQLALALDDRSGRFHVVLTLRSDFEPQFADCALKGRWSGARYVVPPMSQDELREAIEGPASARVLYFKPSGLVDRLINDVVQTPGALPLLSFTLRELYVRYVERGGEDRSLVLEDYEALGGVAGCLRNRANEEYDRQPDDACRATMRRVMLRMVSLEGGELARRRVPRSELDYADPAENARVGQVLERLCAVRLVVEGREENGEPFVEPAHDELIRGWDRLLSWSREEQEGLQLRRLVTPAANDWERKQGGLWHANPRLGLLTRLLRSPDNWLNRAETRFVVESRRWRRTLAVSLAASVLAVFLALLGLTRYAFRERDRAEEQTREVQNRLAQALVENGSKLLGSGDTQGALVSFVEALKVAEGARPRSAPGLLTGFTRLFGSAPAEEDGTTLHRQRVGTLLRHCPRQAEFPKRVWNFKSSTDTALSPDGGLLWADGRVWDVDTGKRGAGNWRGGGRPLERGLFGPGAQWIAAYSAAGPVVQIRHLPRGELLWEFDLGTQVVRLAPSDDGKRLAVAGAKSARVWDLTNGKPVTPLLEHPSDISHLALSARGTRLAAGSADAKVLIWDLTARPPGAAGIPLLLPEKRLPEKRPWRLQCLALRPDGHWLAAALDNDRWTEVMVWSADTGRQAHFFQPLKHGSPVRSIHYSSTGKRLVTATHQGLVYLWDDNGKPIRKYGIGGYGAGVMGGFLTADERYVVGVLHGETQIFDAATGERLARVGCYAFPDHVRVSGDQVTILASGDFGASFPGRGGVPVGHRASLRETGFEPPGGRTYPLFGLHSCSWRFALSAEGESILEHGEGQKPTCADFSPDGRRVVTGDEAGRLRAWDCESGRLLTASAEPGAAVRSVAFASDGRSLLVERADGTVEAWDPSTGTALTPRRRTDIEEAEVRLARDGRTALFTTPQVQDGRPRPGGWKLGKGMAQLWDVVEGRMLRGPLAYDGSTLDALAGPSRCLVVCDNLGGRRGMGYRLLDVHSGRATQLPATGEPLDRQKRVPVVDVVDQHVAGQDLRCQPSG